MDDFSGVKVALVCEDLVLVIQRDDRPMLQYPGMWEFAGGAREGDETPVACAQREVKEELGLDLRADSIIWQKKYQSLISSGKYAYFMVARISRADVPRIVFGDEGQGWKLVPSAELLVDESVIGFLRERFKEYTARKG